MGFDTKRFSRTQFHHREGVVPVPGLAEWFGEDDTPQFTVRGLDGAELARVQDAERDTRHWSAIIEGLAGDTKRDKIEALRDLLGRTGDVPSQLVRRIEAVEIGLIAPELDRAELVKLASAYPVEFQQISTEVFRLTGMGQDPGKAPGFGETPASEPRSASGRKTDSVSSSSGPTCSPEES